MHRRQEADTENTILVHHQITKPWAACVALRVPVLTFHWEHPTLFLVIGLLTGPSKRPSKGESLWEKERDRKSKILEGMQAKCAKK